MDTKLKKMTANIKGIKGWFVLTVLGLDVLLGIDGGNVISTFYGDVIIYVAFLATVTAGIMLTISLRPDSKEWPFFVIFDNFKTDTLFWLELLIVTCTMAAFAWIAGLYESWSWAYSAISIMGKLLFLVLVLPEAFVAVSCYAIFIRRMKDREKRRGLWIQSVFPKHEKKQKVKTFSGGMKQRLGLALALINHPDLLILDEPLNGLDPQGIVELREILSHLNKKYGITMLISSHILDELEMIATRYGFIHQGQMIEEITAEKLQEKLKKYISLDVENIGLASITLEQKLHTENFKVMDDHTIYLYDFVNESSLVATTLIQEGVILNKMNISNVSLENYYLSLIKGVESHV